MTANSVKVKSLSEYVYVVSVFSTVSRLDYLVRSNPLVGSITWYVRIR